MDLLVNLFVCTKNQYEGKCINLKTSRIKNNLICLSSLELILQSRRVHIFFRKLIKSFSQVKTPAFEWKLFFSFFFMTANQFFFIVHGSAFSKLIFLFTNLFVWQNTAEILINKLSIFVLVTVMFSDRKKFGGFWSHAKWSCLNIDKTML